MAVFRRQAEEGLAARYILILGTPVLTVLDQLRSLSLSFFLSLALQSVLSHSDRLDALCCTAMIIVQSSAVFPHLPTPEVLLPTALYLTLLTAFVCRVCRCSSQGSNDVSAHQATRYALPPMLGRSPNVPNVFTESPNVRDRFSPRVFTTMRSTDHPKGMPILWKQGSYAWQTEENLETQ